MLLFCSVRGFSSVGFITYGVGVRMLPPFLAGLLLVCGMWDKGASLGFVTQSLCAVGSIGCSALGWWVHVFIISGLFG